MIVSRRSLLRKLRIVKPALAGDDLVPVNTHFQFNGEHLVASNGRITIAVPQQSLKGAVPAILLDFLTTSKAAAVEIKAAKRKVKIRFDGTTITLPTCPVDDLQLQIPSGWPARCAPVAFLQAIEHCLQSVAPYSKQPDMLGVTLIPTTDGLELFSTNGEALRFARLASFKLKERVVLHGEFCRQMLRLAETARSWRLDSSDDQAVFAADDVLLRGRVIRTEQPLDFVDIVRRCVPEDYASTSIPLPKPLPSLLDHFALITNIAGRNIGTEISIENGIASFAAQSERGAATGQLAMPYHPDVRVSVLSHQLCEPCKWPERLLITERAIIMNSGAHFFLGTTKRRAE